MAISVLMRLLKSLLWPDETIGRLSSGRKPGIDQFGCLLRGHLGTRRCMQPMKMKVILTMAQSYIGQKRPRRYYGKIHEVLEMPNLIEVQSLLMIYSYNPEMHQNRGMAKALRAFSSLFFRLRILTRHLFWNLVAMSWKGKI